MSYRMMEESVLVAKECGRTDEVCRLALGATQLYREHGSPASALYLLKRAAKILENKVGSWMIFLSCEVAHVAELIICIRDDLCAFLKFLRLSETC